METKPTAPLCHSPKCGQRWGIRLPDSFCTISWANISHVVVVLPMSLLPWKHCIRRSGKAGCPLLIRRQGGRSLFLALSFCSIFLLHLVLYKLGGGGGGALQTICWIGPAQRPAIHTKQPNIQPSSHSGFHWISVTFRTVICSSNWDDSLYITLRQRLAPLCDV